MITNYNDFNFVFDPLANGENGVLTVNKFYKKIYFAIFKFSVEGTVKNNINKILFNNANSKKAFDLFKRDIYKKAFDIYRRHDWQVSLAGQIDELKSYLISYLYSEFYNDSYVDISDETYRALKYTSKRCKDLLIKRLVRLIDNLSNVDQYLLLLNYNINIDELVEEKIIRYLQ